MLLTLLILYLFTRVYKLLSVCRLFIHEGFMVFTFKIEPHGKQYSSWIGTELEEVNVT